MSKFISKTEQKFRDAFKRLVDRGEKVTQNKVAIEAGMHSTALKKDRFPVFVIELQDYIKNQNLNNELIAKKADRVNRRASDERYKACKEQRDKLASICEAQANLIDDLQNQIAELKAGISRPLNFRKDN